MMNTNDDDKAKSDTLEEKYSNESEQLTNPQFDGVSDMLGMMTRDHKRGSFSQIYIMFQMIRRIVLQRWKGRKPERVWFGYLNN